ncbi:tetratricopeptide repeat protein [Roseospira navarrensis]|nr:tetratricopeptide repeat protein [Roseospira navarrensis]
MAQRAQMAQSVSFPPARRPAQAAFVVLWAALALTPAACAHPGDTAAEPTGAAGLTRLAAADATAPEGASNGGPAAKAPDASTDDAAQGPSGRALGKYLAGRAAQYDNNISAAASHFADALAADPGNPMLMRRAYYYLMADGRFDEAVGVARDAVVALAGEDFAPLLLASSAMRDGNPNDAVGWLWPIEANGLNALLQPMLLAWARLDTGDLDGALEALEPARSMASARRLVDLHGILIADISGDRARAGALLDAYLEDGPPDNARPLELIVMLLTHQGRTAEALDLVEDYLAQGPAPLMVSDLAARVRAEGADGVSDLVTTAREGYAEALYHTGLAVNQGQGSDTAIVLMQMALGVNPDFQRAALGIAETLRRMKQYEAANTVLQEIDTTDDPALDYVTRLYLAENLEQLDRIDEALARYDALAETHPDQLEPLVDKGDLLRRADRFAEAAEAYSVAIDRIDNDNGVALWPVLYRRGVSYERAGEWDKAEADFLRALDLEPDQPEILNYLGYSWLDRGENIERAVDMVKEAVRQRPNDGYIVDSLGWGYYLLGRYEEAVVELERAVELRPQDWTINDHLGDAYWRVGRRTEARFQWERALSLEPEEDTIPEIEAKLETGLEPVAEGGR